MAQHTPGPWRYSVEPVNSVGGSLPYTILSAGRGHYARESCNGFRMTGVCNESDARLMEAAPDLLAACKGLHALLSKLDVHRDSAELRDAEAAIRKAEGK